MHIFVQEQILPVGNLCHKMHFPIKFLLVLMVRKLMSEYVLVLISPKVDVSIVSWFDPQLTKYLTGGGLPDRKYAARHSRGC